MTTLTTTPSRPLPTCVLLPPSTSACSTPSSVQMVPGLPKTRSGKIMRRILRKIAEDQPDQLGDISTLADPAVVQVISDAHARQHPPQ